MEVRARPETKRLHGKNGETAEHIHFDSIKEIVDATVHPKNEKVWTALVRRHNTAWFGSFPSETKLSKALKEGWAEGEAKMRRELGHLRLKMKRTKSRRRKRYRGESGEHLDVNALYNGSFDRMWEGTKRPEDRNKKSGKRVVIAVEMFTSSMHSESKMFWRGAVAAFLCEELTKQGYSVEIIATVMPKGLYTHARKGEWTMASTTLKRSDERLNLNAVLVACASASFFRILGFKSQLCIHKTVGAWMGTPGGRTAQSFKDKGFHVPMLERHAEHLLCVDHIWSKADAEEYIGKQLNTILGRGDEAEKELTEMEQLRKGGCIR